MSETTRQLFENGSGEAILAALDTALGKSSESPFWTEKIPPLIRALLSVLLPLRDQQLLFTPEGEPRTLLTPELLLRWCDMVCLKHLAFTLRISNSSGRLERTRYTADRTTAYRPVDTELLDRYLSGYGVDLRNEFADFPIAHYNLHLGISNVLKSIL